MKSFFFILIASISLLMSSCGAKPKVIEAESASSGEPAHTHEATGSSTDVHQVICEDFLHTDRYTYMDVTENGNRFWIAVPRQEVEKGATYMYAGGLMKKNFKSEEFDRVFETIYLVSNVTRLAAEGGSAVDRALAQQQNQQPSSAPVNMSPSEGVVKLSALFANPAKYEGKVISVQGRCVKINKMIMGRNWVHLDDGSAPGKDLTITTMADVPVGASATLTGAISLNVDFGAGYKYEVIMENAKLE
jgi:starvation-inducible outer membrane lipoprotein